MGGAQSSGGGGVKGKNKIGTRELQRRKQQDRNGTG